VSRSKRLGVYLSGGDWLLVSAYLEQSPNHLMKKLAEVIDREVETAKKNDLYQRRGMFIAGVRQGDTFPDEKQVDALLSEHGLELRNADNLAGAGEDDGPWPYVMCSSCGEVVDARGPILRTNHGWMCSVCDVHRRQAVAGEGGGE
jgi:hypothetical protein